MSDRDLPDDVRAVLAELETRYDVSAADAKVVHQHSNTAIALPSASLLVRIAGNPDALDDVAASVRVTRWLAGRRYRCVVPADLEPFEAAGKVTSIWRLLDVANGPPGSAGELGQLLRDLHDQPPVPFSLRALKDPLASVERAAQASRPGLGDHHLSWLLDRIASLRVSWNTLAYSIPGGLIHGDAHSNNLIRLISGDVVLGDWDHVATGPREWDLIQPYYMARRFGRHSDQELEDFTRAYGWDVRTAENFELLIQIREISGLSPYIRQSEIHEQSRQEVAYRLDTLRTKDTEAPWNPPSRVAQSQTTAED